MRLKSDWLRRMKRLRQSASRPALKLNSSMEKEIEKIDGEYDEVKSEIREDDER